MEKKKALIIDKERDFCLLMSQYLSCKNIDSYYTDTIQEGIEIIEIKKPDIVIGDESLLGLENSIHFTINAINDYNPEVFLTNATLHAKEGSRTDLIDEIIKWIKDKFY
jgi:DNA-binding response OmpR family regulator